MTGKDLLIALGDISHKYYDEAEKDAIVLQRKPLRRPLLIAAVIALMLLLVGCAVVYVLHMQDLKIGQRETTRYVFDEYHRQVTGTEPVTQQVLTLSGLEGSPSYLAAQKWFNFLDGYDPEGQIRKEAFQGDPEALYPDTYLTYGTYSQEMVDKLEELAEKYGLTLLGAPMEFDSMKAFTRAIGIDHVLLADSGASAYLSGGTCYPGGNFNLSIKLNMPQGEGMWPYSIHAQLVYCRKDCLSTAFQYLDAAKDWKEWTYAAASGQTVLILRTSGEGDAYLFCDCGDATITVLFEPGYNPLTDDPDFEPEWMTDRQIEQVADAIDFTIRPQLPDADVPAPIGHADGWEIQWKSAAVDGNAGRIVFSLSAPAGTVLYNDMGDYLYPDNWDRDLFRPESGEYKLDSYSTCYTEDDGDGLPHTADLVYKFLLDTVDDPAFPLEETWTAHMEDLTLSYWNGRNHIDEIIAEGIWEVEFRFADSDFRGIELLDAPVTISVPSKWDENGPVEYAQVTIESFELRNLGAIITLAKGSDSRFLTAEAVRKDGSVVPLALGSSTGLTVRKLAEETINLDQVSFVRLQDGTELPIPQR